MAGQGHESHRDQGEEKVKESCGGNSLVESCLLDVSGTIWEGPGRSKSSLGGSGMIWKGPE